MIKVKLANPSKISKSDTTLTTDDQSVVVSRSIYQNLGSLLKNKTLTDSYENGPIPDEYKKFLDQMDDLFLKLNYPALAVDIVVDPAIEEVDEYLGELGILQDYFYEKDTVNIPQWLDTLDIEPVRVLYDESDNTYLVDGSDDTVLVYYSQPENIRRNRRT